MRARREAWSLGASLNDLGFYPRGLLTPKELIMMNDFHQAALPGDRVHQPKTIANPK